MTQPPGSAPPYLPPAPPSPPAESDPAGRPPGSFAVNGLIAAAVTAVAVPLGLFDRIPFVGDLLTSSGAVGTIAAIALTASLWVMFFALGRAVHGSRERAAVQAARRRLAGDPVASSPRELVRHLVRAIPAGTLVHRRLTSLAGSAEEESTADLLATRSELDHARSDVSYGPARALVWALPALGFLGTAAEMARAVDGLGVGVGSSGGYNALRDALVKDVIPPLGDAFGVTLFALGASVLCHLVLTWTGSREQRIMLEVEEVVLEVLERAPAVRGRVVGPGELNGEMRMLASVLDQTRAVVADSTDRLTAVNVGEVGLLLHSVDRRLGQIHAELAKEMVVSRVAKPSRD
ncbi:hypothetical protein FHX41_0070 [Actinomadura hallensis]|uniref:MotA/TolQ/ExbB proton channel family protein n=1 Tax=Actinomadura hallensis TaxID=337895 RepID=A0A543I7B4_9ACTN|nr:hypothetical protein [Actinomadura hallensis]TQM66496.1 hypothetical protein FHX41_0070 [Actinomadura hallensis]